MGKIYIYIYIISICIIVSHTAHPDIHIRNFPCENCWTIWIVWEMNGSPKKISWLQFPVQNQRPLVGPENTSLLQVGSRYCRKSPNVWQKVINTLHLSWGKWFCIKRLIDSLRYLILSSKHAPGCHIFRSWFCGERAEPWFCKGQFPPPFFKHSRCWISLDFGKTILPGLFESKPGVAAME